MGSRGGGGLGSGGDRGGGGMGVGGCVVGPGVVGVKEWWGSRVIGVGSRGW